MTEKIQTSTTVLRKLEDWKRRLIDQTRRNRLIFFRETKSSTVEIVGPAPEICANWLVQDERNWKFYLPEPLRQMPLNDNGPESDTEPDAVQRSQISSREPRSDELVAATRQLPKLEKILRNLQKRSESDLNERGVRVLHLAVGVLRWAEVEDTRPIDSPLILIPVELQRASFRDPFFLKAVDEDPVVNPALATKLMNDFRIALPSLEDDWQPTTYRDFLRATSELVRPLGWKVLDTSWLGLFSFFKLVMYQDLLKNAAFLGSHEIVSALAEQRVLERTAESVEPVDPRELDLLALPASSNLVVDADSSQLACVETVKRGSHLVVQGPPGTGKSQTITNMIAEAIASGKRVLFVSEKMAALDVVYKRLRAAHLGAYCLELHSQKANKRAVVQELYRTYQNRVVPSPGLSTLAINRLIQQQDALNAYVHALHVRREPLGLSVYQVMGMLSERGSCATVPCDRLDVTALTLTGFADFTEMAARLKALWQVVSEGVRHPWYGVALEEASTAVIRACDRVLGATAVAIEKTIDAVRDAAAQLALKTPTDLRDANSILHLLQVLRRSPGIPNGWLTDSDFAGLRMQALRLADTARHINADLSIILEDYRPDVLSLPIDFLPMIRETVDGLTSMTGVDVAALPDPVSATDQLRSFGNQISTTIQGIDAPLTIISTSLGTGSVASLGAARQLLHLGELCVGKARPDETWFSPGHLERVATTVPSYRKRVERRNHLRDATLRDYTQGLFDLDLDQLRSDLLAKYTGPLRWLRPSYYVFRRLIRSVRRNHSFSGTLLDDLDRAREVRRLENQCQEVSTEVREVLGAWYREFETDFEAVGRAVATAEEILKLTSGTPPQGVITCSHCGRRPPEQLKGALEHLAIAMNAYEEGCRHISPAVRAKIEGVPRQTLASFADRLGKAAKTCKAALAAVTSLRCDEKPRAAEDLIKDLDRVRVVQGQMAQFQSAADPLASRIGPSYQGLATDWRDLSARLDYGMALIEALNEEPATESIRAIAGNSRQGCPDPDKLGGCLEELENDWADLARVLGHAADKSYPQTPEGEPLRASSFEIALGRVSVMQKRLDELRDWVDLSTLRKGFVAADLGDVWDGVVSLEGLRSDEIVHVVEKSVLQEWFDQTIRRDSVFRSFRSEDHQRIVEEFQDLDRRLIRTGASRVIGAIESNRPDDIVVSPGGEVALLLREAMKKKRHIPIRKLFDQAPRLVSHLKPCLLMSPLSVAQFLGPATFFDLVVFDEASQICSEDAVGSIARGRKLVVCGDNKQLPPTSFFNQSDADFGDGQPDEEQFEVFESILDQCLSIGLPQAWLRWHYRSRHESLIAFSNRRFYDNRLVTFPSPVAADARYGVALKLVPDAVFDRGGRADNPIEADEVVRQVLHHFENSPGKSLGVVTFSVAQREAVTDRLELAMRDSRAFAEWVSGAGGEPLFVKNLESVQGDERDSIIFSVGYGRDAQGRLTMNFGPLNWDGGQRRLNVAITRARERVLVVSSISAADFKLNERLPPGVLSLHRYLDFADRGLPALEEDIPDSLGAVESPLEASVAGAIRELGYEVISQVGCSGYRIDMAVSHPAEPGRFILGVECDGATYHSSYTARDRDRLRQDVLESFGWKIHRVWGPDWISRRKAEVARLQEAITEAVGSSAVEHSATRDESGVMVQLVPRDIPDPSEGDTRFSWAEMYQVCRIDTHPLRTHEFHDPASRHTLCGMMSEVIAIEAPIHIDLLTKRIADRWGLQRIGDRMRQASMRALATLVRSDTSISRDGQIVTRKGAKEDAVRRPDPDDDLSYRRIELIPSTEIAAAIRQLVREAFSLSEVDLLAQVARVFGFDRTGSTIREIVAQTLKTLISDAVVLESDGRLTLAADAD